jgi:hypothetical protein
VPTEGVWNVGIPPPAYVGPGDIVTGAKGWWGLRAYSAAACGTKCANIRRSGGSSPTSQDFNTLATGGLDIAAVTAFQNSDSSTALWIVNLYEQSGGGMGAFYCSTAAQQPQLVLGGTPNATLVFVHANNTCFLIALSSPAINLPFTTSMVGLNNVSSTVTHFFWFLSTFDTAAPGPGFTNTLQCVNSGGGSPVNVTCSDGVYHSHHITSNGASSTMVIDQTNNTGTMGTTNYPGASTFNWSANDSTNTLDGNILEGGIWPSQFTLGQSQSIASNQKTFWGF